MQIVIDIPKEIYCRIMARTDSAYDVLRTIKAVKRGMPLPKGHGRLIDADAVEKKINKSGVEADRNADYYTADKIDCAIEYIINEPTIIEADEEANE